MKNQNSSNFREYKSPDRFAKATLIEFLIYLFILLLLYVGLHWFKNPSLSQASIASLESVSYDINEIQQQLSESSNNTGLLNPETNNQEKILSQKIIDNWEAELKSYPSSIKILRELKSINLDLTPENSQNVIQLLTQLKNSLPNTSFFWTGEKKWLEVICWSLFGTLLFLIKQIADYYTIPSDNKDESQRAQLRLTRRKPEYYYLIVRSPFISLIILFVLSSAQLDIFGVALSFSSIPITVLVSIAFILGFFNQVATTQLEMIVAGIFKGAWQRTLRKIDIYPDYAAVIYGTNINFDVMPDVKVKWSIWSQSSSPLGIIDMATGMYIASPAPGYSYDKLGNLNKIDQNDSQLDKYYEQVIIKAERLNEPPISDGEPAVSGFALITLISANIVLEIDSKDPFLANSDEKIQFCVNITDKDQSTAKSIPQHLIPIIWRIQTKSINQSEDIGKINSKGEYTAPSQIKQLMKLEVRAEMRDYPYIYDKTEITLLPPNGSNHNQSIIQGSGSKKKAQN